MVRGGATLQQQGETDVWMQDPWLNSIEKNQKIYRDAVKKTYGLPADDMQFSNSSTSGMGWKELSVIGLIALALIFGSQWMNRSPVNVQQQTQTPAAAPTQTKAPTDSEYMVRFYDKDGNPIDVPHISQKPK